MKRRATQIYDMPSRGLPGLQLHVNDSGLDKMLWLDVLGNDQHTESSLLSAGPNSGDDHIIM